MATVMLFLHKDSLNEFQMLCLRGSHGNRDVTIT
jgi:hypothetical protein